MKGIFEKNVFNEVNEVGLVVKSGSLQRQSDQTNAFIKFTFSLQFDYTMNIFDKETTIVYAFRDSLSMVSNLSIPGLIENPTLDTNVDIIGKY